jgi:hypothetical protein
MPLVPFVGVTLNNTPLQVTVVIELTTGIELSVTVKLKATPKQFPEVGRTL